MVQEGHVAIFSHHSSVLFIKSFLVFQVNYVLGFNYSCYLSVVYISLHKINDQDELSENSPGIDINNTG